MIKEIKMDEKNRTRSNIMIRSLCVIAGIVPLSVTLAATALVFQQAEMIRANHVTDDEVTSSIIGWIHPAALAALIAGYILSGALIILLRWSLSRRPPFPHADHQDQRA